MITKDQKLELIEQFGKSTSDTGSRSADCNLQYSNQRIDGAPENSFEGSLNPSWLVKARW